MPSFWCFVCWEASRGFPRVAVFEVTKKVAARVLWTSPSFSQWDCPLTKAVWVKLPETLVLLSLALMILSVFNILSLTGDKVLYCATIVIILLHTLPQPSVNGNGIRCLVINWTTPLQVVVVVRWHFASFGFYLCLFFFCNGSFSWLVNVIHIFGICWMGFESLMPPNFAIWKLPFSVSMHLNQRLLILFYVLPPQYHCFKT